MLHTVSVAGLTITAASKNEILSEVSARLEQGTSTRIITPYSEFLFAALKNPGIMNMLNDADIAIADGVGMLWAATYLQRPLSATSWFFRMAQAVWLMMSTGAQILLNPSSIYKTIPEKIVGADFFWDLAGLAEKNNKSIFLLGGFGNTNEIVATKLRAQYPQLQIAGTSTANYPGDATLLEQIRNSRADFLFIAWGPIRQEQWAADHMLELPNIKLSIGLGATFDYVAGTRKAPPKFIRSIGLEWLFRLITQPKRYKRIYNATFGLITALIQYKVRHMDETHTS